MDSCQSFEGTMSLRWIKPITAVKGKRIQDPTSGILEIKFRNSTNGKIIEEITPVNVVYKREYTKIFNEKLGCFVDDYPLNNYLIKNSDKIIFYTPVKENLYAIFVEKALQD